MDIPNIDIPNKNGYIANKLVHMSQLVLPPVPGTTYNYIVDKLFKQDGDFSLYTSKHRFNKNLVLSN